MVKESKGDAENAQGFNPFKERKVSNPTTDLDTLTHLLKSCLGTGLLAMPMAFRSAGLVVGIFGTILVAFVCTHCAYILVKCAHILYYKTHKTEMSFAEVSVTSFSIGPEWAKPLATPSRYLIQISLFLTYYGTCSVYTVIIAKSFKQLLDYYLGYLVDERLVMCALLVPLVLLGWVPDLKYLAPVSMVANIFMGTSLGITFYYLIKDLQPIDTDMLSLATDISQFPDFFSITVFAIEAIGVVMPLENNMQTPEHFTGICGVLNRGMSGVTVIYILLGFLGYARFGDDTCGSITLNLPISEIPAQIVKIFVAVAVYGTFGLQFYVCLDIVWSGIKDHFVGKSILANYVLRTLLAIGAVLLAIAVPTIGPFTALIGAFCFSILGILIPIFIETVTYWDIGFGRFNWIAVKNVIVGTIGVFALIFGTRSALLEIAALYAEQEHERSIR